MKNFRIAAMLSVLAVQGTTALAQSNHAQEPAAVSPRRAGKKTVSVVDTVFNNMPAYTVTIPADWTFDAAILRSSCGDNLPFLVFRTYSPDKLTGVQRLPRADWYAAADTRAYQLGGVAPCNLHAPARSADVAPKIATDLRIGAQVVAAPPLTPAEVASAQGSYDAANARMQAASAGTPGFVTKFSGDSQRVRLRYDFEGHAIEEWISVGITIADQPVSVVNTGRNGIIQPGIARLLHSTIFVNGIRAPLGKLDSMEAPLKEILESVKIIPEYDQAYLAYMRGEQQKVVAAIQRMGQTTLANGEQFARNMQAQNDRFHAWQADVRTRNQQKFAQDMQRKDSQAQNFLDYVKDQTYYVNPSTGATVTIQNQPGVAGYYGQNPSGNWTQLVPISH